MTKIAILLQAIIPVAVVLRRVARAAKRLDIADVVAAAFAHRDDVIGFQHDRGFGPDAAQAPMPGAAFQCFPLGSGKSATIPLLPGPIVGLIRGQIRPIRESIARFYRAVLRTIIGVGTFPCDMPRGLFLAFSGALAALRPVLPVSLGMIAPCTMNPIEVCLRVAPIARLRFRQCFVPFRPISSALTRTALRIQAVLCLTRWGVIGAWQRLSTFRATFIGNGERELLVNFGHLSTSNVLGSCPRWLQPRGGFVLPNYSKKSEVWP